MKKKFLYSDPRYDAWDFAARAGLDHLDDLRREHGENGAYPSVSVMPGVPVRIQPEYNQRSMIGSHGAMCAEKVERGFSYQGGIGRR